MIICGNCGASNDDGVTFCGTCGKYLEFVGETADTPEGEAAAKAGTPAAADAVPLVVPVDAARGTAGGAAAAAGQAATAGEAEAPPRPPAPSTASGASTASAPSTEQAAPRPPAPSTAPVPPSTPSAGAARDTAPPVLPGVAGPRRRPASLPPEDRKVQPGELICGNCGAGNAPTRGFCRRCGATLADAPVAPPPPWWRRWVSHDRDGQPRAGYRPRRAVRHAYRGKIAFVAVLGLLGAAGWTYWPTLTRLAASVVDRRSGTSPVEPLRLTASSHLRGHSEMLLLDGKSNTFWAPVTLREGRGQHVDASFRPPFRLVAAVVFNGASATGPGYRAQGRPRTLEFTFTTAAGKSTREVVLKDEPGQQLLYLGVDDVTAVRTTIVDTTGTGPGKFVALAELGFLQRA